MNNLHSKTIAFTGHRFIPFDRQPKVKSLLRQSIANIYKQGFFTYYCGMAMGFDLLAAEVIISMKEQGFPNLKLIAVVPYRNQSERFSQRDKQRYNNALSKADEVIVLSENYTQKCFLQRNDYMLDHAGCVFAYLSRTDRGGTYYTCKKAVNRRICVVNFFSEQHPQINNNHITK